MQPGPDYIYLCPTCGDCYSTESIISGNTFGSVYFSDGKQISSMLPEFPVLSKCTNCNTIFWLSKATKHIFNPFDYLPRRFMNKERFIELDKFTNATKAKFLSIYEYEEAIKNKIYTNKGQEIFLRIKIWWGFNDRIRNKESVFIIDNDKPLWRNNLNRLLKILDIDDINHLFMIAEINRNLGKFEKCLQVIENINSIEYDIFKNKLIENCNLKNTKVFQIN